MILYKIFNNAAVYITHKHMEEKEIFKQTIATL